MRKRRDGEFASHPRIHRRSGNKEEGTTVRLIRLFALSVAAATLCTASYAQVNCKKPTPPPKPVISKVIANTFQLKQVSTKVLADGSSTSLYRGETVLTITSDDPTLAPTLVPVKVELKTQTLLNKSGDGLTDGAITLYAPATRQAIVGPLVAVNENFGDLTGVIEGCILGNGASQARLRAVFHGVFVKDDAGAYTLVNVDAKGVQLVTPKTGGPKK